MDKLFIKPLFPDKSNAPTGRINLSRALDSPNPLTAEVIGALVHNARQNGGISLFDEPIPIDPYDQQRLLSFGLVRSTFEKPRKEHDIAVTVLTSLGQYVVSNAILIESAVEHKDMPYVDTARLKELLN